MQVASFDKYDRGEGYGKNIPKVLRMCLKPQYHYLKRLEWLMKEILKSILFFSLELN